MPARIDISGKVFGRLTVRKDVGRDRFGQVLWECECVCGKKVIARGGDLRSGNTKSCGCWDIERAVATIRKQTINHSNPASIKTKKLSVANTSGVRGVCPTKRGTWRAYIGHKGQHIFLGEYSRFDDAVKARKRGEEKYFTPVLEELKANKN